jgi:hypothetical protein
LSVFLRVFFVRRFSGDKAGSDPSELQQFP